MSINSVTPFDEIRTLYDKLQSTQPSGKYPFDIEVPIADVKEIGKLAAGLRERLRYMGALAFVHLNPQTGEHARIVDYDAATSTIYYVHEDCHFQNDCVMERLQQHRVETIEYHIDGSVPGCGVFHVWVEGWKPRID